MSVRLKPFSDNEQQKKGQWQVSNETSINHLHAKESFTFDRIFEPAVTTSQIFESELKSMIYNALKGYNVAVLAYGQTNSGKTFTIRGVPGSAKRPCQPGIISLTAALIFKSVDYLQTPEGIEQSLKQKSDTSDLSFQVPPESGANS